MASKKTKTRAQWVLEIKSLGRKSAETLIALGRALTEAKADLGHGQFGAMLRDDLKPHQRAAQRLMKLAHNPRFAKATNLSLLPSALSALEALAEAPEEIIEHEIATGRIHPQMTATEARTVGVACRDLTPPAAQPTYVSVRDVTIPQADRDRQNRLQSVKDAVSALASRESDAIEIAETAAMQSHDQTFKHHIKIAIDFLVELSAAMGERRH